MVAADPDAGNQAGGGGVLRAPVGHGFVHHVGLQQGGAQVGEKRGLRDDGGRLGDPVQVAPSRGRSDDAGGLAGGQRGRATALPGGASSQVGPAAPHLDGGSGGVVVEVVLECRLRPLAHLLVLQQHLLDPDLLENSRQLVVVEEVNH